MRRPMSVAACVRAALLCLMLALGLAPAAQAQDLGESASPLANLSEVEVAEEAHVLLFTETAAFRHTEAITQGVPKLQAAFTAAGITSEHTEDSSVFNDAKLATFDALVMFQASGDPWTAEEKAAMERYQRAGGGIVAIHNATDMRGNYAWWDNLIGALMPGHAATGTSPGQPGEVIVEDQVHPSTKHLSDRWARSDEWYNFNRNVRGDAHVLATMDETTYDAGGNAMGYDHPISWCKPYDGGRAWVTGMGHFGAHYDEPALLAHIVGGVKWAAGIAPGDCGGTRNDSFEKVALDENTSAPFALDVAPDGRVLFTELVRGQIRVYDPEARTVKTAITLDVYSGGEDGLLGIAVDPNFEQNGYVYVYHSPDRPNNADPSSFFSRVSRFTMDDNSDIDPASEELIIEVPARREPDEPGHTGGGLDFDNEGNLLLSVGDDVNPHSEPSGGYAPLSERTGTFHDARETSANTNDLRGKLLRVTPNRTAGEGGYTIPEGNMFPEAEDTANKTLPEIYAMGFRNPFRFSVDPDTGWIGLADYAPDSGQDRPADRGPAGIVEWNLIKGPGNYGWPLCMGNNEPFRDVEYLDGGGTNVGGFFDCANPVNDSKRNTGLTNLPPAIAPDMWYGYTKSSVPAVIPAGGGLAPMGGPFYDFDPDSTSDVKFPEYFDGKPFFYEWSKNRLYSMILDDQGGFEKISRFLPNQSFMSPQDLKFGPDGALYTLEWGGGFGRDNPNSGIYRVDYITGSRSPLAQATATPDNGQEPLEVSFSGLGSNDPEGASLTYAWDFDGNGTTDSTEVMPVHTYTQPGVYQARLTVTDPDGKTGTTVIPVTVGNTRPQVDITGPPDGSFLDWGDTVDWSVAVTDPEDGTVDPQNVIVQPALGHDGHTHPTVAQRGTSGSVVTELGGGHSEDMKVFFALDARYTDGGDGDVPPLTGSDTIVLQPKHKEAEHADRSAGTSTAPATGDLEGGDAALTGLGGGDWAVYEPVNFTDTDSITFRVASSQAGGAIELRKDAPDGELLGTAAVPDTGSTQRWTDVKVDAPASTDTMSLYLVFTGEANFRLNFLEVGGKGLSQDTRPEVAVTSPTEMQALDPGANTLAAEATDAENTISKVEFFVDGEKVGEDAEAPYSIEWTETDEDYYVVHAVATNSKGLTADSRKVRFTIGEFGVRPPWETFSSAEPAATFDQLGTNFTVSAAGSDVWRATNQYGAVYLPGGAPENFVATVKVASFDATHPSAKAGIMVRNDITQSGTSPGYMVVGEKGDGTTEFMHDAGGNGQVNNDAAEPVATACPGNNIPTWLKVAKFGTKFSAYCSKNGTDWTQVGATTDIPSATTTQDIGMFVVSHIAGTKATAEFTDWAIDTDPEPPEEPEEPSDPAPSCQGSASDEFDGPLSDDRWTVQRGATGLAPATSDGSLIAPVPFGDIDGGNPGPISYVGQRLPSGDWQATTKLSLDQDNEWQYGALAIHVDDNNYTKLAFTENTSGGRFVEFWSETNGSRTGHGSNANLPADFPTTIHLRLTNAGGTLTGAYSADGTTWTDINGTAPLKTGGTFGLLAAGDTDAHNKDAAFDYFRVTPDVVAEDPGPNDEFDGAELDGCRWDKIVNYNSNRLDLADGKLSIDTFDADISGANNGEIENLVLQTPPEGDWTVETKMTAPLGDNWQLAGFMLYSDDDHYVKYDVVADNAPGAAPERRVELRYENGGGLTGPGVQDLAPPASTTDTWWLRLKKAGDTYTGQISADGETWQDTPGSVTVALTDPAIGLMAMGPEQASPITVDFEYFRVLEDEPENTAPTVAAAADPTSGEAPLPVAFTAAGEDADDDELTYSWDFDGDGTEDSTEQNPSHVYEQAGSYTAKVTVEDPDGATGTDEVQITVEQATDPEAPAVQGFADRQSGEAPLRVRFTSTALDPEGGALDYVWEFGNGDRAFTRNATYTYTEPGTFTAQVTVTDEQGKTASDEIEITVAEAVNAEPTVEATADVTSGGAPLRVQFGATGADEEDRPRDLSYEWDFGDGAGSLARNPAHVYRTPGTHTATVTVTDSEGATGTDSVEVTVTNAAPTVEAAATPRSGTAPLRVRLTSQGTDADGDRLTYAWDTGDGGSADTRNAWHTYMEAGTYEAKVTVSDRHGATGSETVEITVADPPGNAAPTVRMAADPKTGTAPLRVRFSSAASDPDGDRLASVWDFGDGGKAGGTRATHVYTRPGTYDATVTVTDPGGKTGTATMQIVVAGPPAVAQAAPQTAAPAPAGDVAGETAFSPLVSVRSSAKVGRIARRGLRYTVGCERACRVWSTLRLKGKRIGRAKARSVRAGASRTIVLRLDRKVRGRLAEAMSKAGLQRVKATVVTEFRTEDGTRRVRERIVLER
jgi:PKD repeat protein/type 1 glutamine amidotransferase